MPRAYTREPTHPDTESEQTDDDCEWLDEENGEEDVLRYWPDRYRCRYAPGVVQHERRDFGGQDNSNAEHRRRDGGHERGAGQVGILTLC